MSSMKCTVVHKEVTVEERVISHELTIVKIIGKSKRATVYVEQYWITKGLDSSEVQDPNGFQVSTYAAPKHITKKAVEKLKQMVREHPRYVQPGAIRRMRIPKRVG